MPPFTFEEARRENVWLRAMLMGPTGAGKTLGALELASNLFDGTLPIVGIDTEHGRMRLYADRYRFQHGELLDHSPEAWKAAFEEANRVAPGGVCIADSFSHEWMGNNGVLSLADRFGDWKQVRPRHNDLIEFIMGLPMHLIVCVRSKMKYNVEEYEDGNRTRQRISKLGLGPIQDDTLPYEFDIVGSVDVSTHDVTFSNRCDPLVDQTMSLVPGKPVADIITTWLSEGEPPVLPEEAGEAEVTELVESLRAEGFPDDKIEAGLAKARARSKGVLTPEYVSEAYAGSQKRLAEKMPAAPTPAAEPEPATA